MMYKKSALTKAGAIICIIVIALLAIMLLISLPYVFFNGENPFVEPSAPPEQSGGIHITIQPQLENDTFSTAGYLLLASHFIVTGIIFVLSICILARKKTLILSIGNLLLSSYVLFCYTYLYGDCCRSVLLIIPMLCFIGSLLSVIGSFIDKGKRHD